MEEDPRGVSPNLFVLLFYVIISALPIQIIHVGRSAADDSVDLPQMRKPLPEIENIFLVCSNF